MDISSKQKTNEEVETWSGDKIPRLLWRAGTDEKILESTVEAMKRLFGTMEENTSKLQAGDEFKKQYFRTWHETEHQQD